MGIYVYEDRALGHRRTGRASSPTSCSGSSTRASASPRTRATPTGSTSGPCREYERAVVDIEQFPEKYDVDAPMLDPHDLFRTLE